MVDPGEALRGEVYWLVCLSSCAKSHGNSIRTKEEMLEGVVGSSRR